MVTNAICAIVQMFASCKHTRGKSDHGIKIEGLGLIYRHQLQEIIPGSGRSY
ncbi:hypothetical protein SERLA73DRAFT_144400 [Serpula lacrymans var. lacrymans S7.3]|uniref:Uncharacterized protein n=2 Tax=Serpula lacrymans var. lacrymans TaxID=341189 RepID=F8QBI6_SERL3|nr:uncharacterized protein SERLADRAFT_401557 [Serpula lacrymans var. lacrymans S7.9]EGN94572.1 hypothetical protein SERLA73DRAFT_144400 [Serpula lacrymans var. lacrymans S7.3]EGO20049.1 hypothetical protein SERLADRAFT_401557 [Serpula lacrymans var. lacrymans S7.9]